MNTSGWHSNSHPSDHTSFVFQIEMHQAIRKSIKIQSCLCVFPAPSRRRYLLTGGRREPGAASLALLRTISLKRPRCQTLKRLLPCFLPNIPALSVPSAIQFHSFQLEWIQYSFSLSPSLRPPSSSVPRSLSSDSETGSATFPAPDLLSALVTFCRRCLFD